MCEQTFSEKATIDLQASGYTVFKQTEIDSAWQNYQKLKPVMLVVDTEQAGEVGNQFCYKLRSKGERTPILFLLTEPTIEARINCLQAGADDYVVKPYHQEQFLQLIHLYLQPIPNNNIEKLYCGDLILDLSTRRLIRQNQTIDLTVKEFELLKYLMSNVDQVLSRDNILANVWGYDYQGESNVIEVYIRYLRLKLESFGQKRLIHTVRGVGYILKKS